MTACLSCGSEIDADILSGSDVYGELASGNDRDDLLSAYDGIRYGRETVICAACLDAPSECHECGGTGDPRTDGAGTVAAESCPECDGTGTTRPDLLRNCCK
jgi:hypothetical protein